MIDVKAETQAMRDGAASPRDLGILFSMVEGMPEFLAARFEHANNWRELYQTFDDLVEWCDGHGVPLIT